METINPNLRGQILEAANEIYNTYVAALEKDTGLDVSISMTVASWYDGKPNFHLHSMLHGMTLFNQNAANIDSFREKAPLFIASQANDQRKSVIQQRIAELQKELEDLGKEV